MSERKSQTLNQELGSIDVNEMIATRAYEIFESRGREHGRDIEDWLQAEQEVTESLSGQTLSTVVQEQKQLAAKVGEPVRVERREAPESKSRTTPVGRK